MPWSIELRVAMIPYDTATVGNRINEIFRDTYSILIINYYKLLYLIKFQKNSRTL